jgi:hypothetical protein
VLDVFRKRVVRHTKFSTMSRRSPWMSGHNGLAPSAVDTQDLSAVFKGIVLNSSLGWDIVVPTLVQLGVSLVETVSGKDTVVPATLWTDEALGGLRFLDAPTAQSFVAAFGLLLLRDTFFRHKAARPAIIEQARDMFFVLLFFCH